MQEETKYTTWFVLNFWCQKHLFFHVRNIEGQNSSEHTAQGQTDVKVEIVMYMRAKNLLCSYIFSVCSLSTIFEGKTVLIVKTANGV